MITLKVVTMQVQAEVDITVRGFLGPNKKQKDRPETYIIFFRIYV